MINNLPYELLYEIFYYLPNEDIIDNLFTGSLVKGKPTPSDIFGDLNDADQILFNKVDDFFESLFSFKNTAEYKGDKRIFVTFLPSSSGDFITDTVGNIQPIYTYQSESYFNRGVKNNKMADLSTIELSNYTRETYVPNTEGHFGTTNTEYPKTASKLSFSSKHNLYFNYSSIDEDWEDDGGIVGTPVLFGSGEDMIGPTNARDGGFLISKTEDDTPSLLVPLKKSRDLSEGIGEKPFVIVPENLHPYVKDNLLFYLSKAGIDLGGSATDKVEEDTRRRIGRKQNLTPEQLKELAARRREAYLRKTREGRRKLRKENRQERREERREDREERRNERRQNRNERRGNRQENKNDRREDRRNRRENRKNRRRRR